MYERELFDYPRCKKLGLSSFTCWLLLLLLLFLVFFSLVLFSFQFHYFSYFVPKSHEVGPGPEFERVGFNLLGRSPLVSHFLRMKELMGKEEQPIQAVGRTEIAKLPYPLF